MAFWEKFVSSKKEEVIKPTKETVEKAAEEVGGAGLERTEHDMKIAAARKYYETGKMGKKSDIFVKTSPEEQNKMLEDFVKNPPMNAKWNREKEEYRFEKAVLSGTP
jgi:hypothetical protein